MIAWKIIPNTNDKYKISNYGKVFDLNKNKEVKPYNFEGIKNKICLRIANKRKQRFIHTLVYKTFKGNIKNNQYIYHIDENIYNYYIDNLKLINRNQSKKYIEPVSLKNEIWKDIIGYENRYKVSNKGRIYSMVSNKILKQQLRENYFSILLIDKNQIRTQYLVHRLVAENFIAKIPKKKVVDHIDRNGQNNNINNLRIVTISENNKNCNRKSLNIIQQYNLDGKLLYEYDDIKKIVKKYKLKAPSHIYNCLNGRYKTAHKYIWKYKNKLVIISKSNKFKQIGVFGNYDFSNYEINKFAQVRNIKTKQLLKQHIHTGYYNVTLAIKNKNKRVSQKVHRILAHVYIPKNNNKYNIVNHIDENKLNNDINNLEWTTTKKNIQHSLAKKVKQIDKKTNKIIKIHNSVCDAYRGLNKKYGCDIRYVCNGRRKSAFGYKWSW